jgi:hypothetical protein
VSANKTSFAPGTAPRRGRKLGSRNKRTLLYESIVGAYDETLIKVLIAEAGERRNMGAMRMLIDRLWPVRAPKEEPVAFPLPKLDDSGDVLKAGQRLLAKAAAGQIAIGDAERIMGLLNGLRSMIETVDLAKRVDAMQEALDGALASRTGSPG